MISKINYKKIIEDTVNYIIKNIDGDLTLEKLAERANYSPFHFQKLFKEEMKETPKQFIIKVRLESAVHQLIIHHHKSIKEIAYDCGFSSPAVFSRAFKNYYGITPEIMQKSEPGEMMLLRASSFKLFEKLKYQKVEYKKNGKSKKLSIEIKRMNEITAIFVNASLKDENSIHKAFIDVIRIGNVNDLITGEQMLIGAVYPHLDLYRACLDINPKLLFNEKLDKIKLRPGKYAVFKVKGSLEELFNAMHAFNDLWLPGSGWRIAEIYGFEIFSKNPSLLPYNKIEREVYIPIESAE